MKIHVVVNPAGASGRAWSLWKSLEPIFRESHHEIVLDCSSHDDRITDICKRITTTNEDTYLIIIGGDGTINEAVNGIVNFEKTYFGFIPCGSGNDLGKDLQLPKDKTEIAKQLLKCEVKRECDVGEVILYDDEKTFTRRFNISCGFGYDAEICAFVEASKLKKVLNKMRLGKLVYLFEGAKVIFSTQLTPMTLTYNNQTYHYEKCLFTVGMNHAYEGGGFKFCPDADANDRKLDICIAEKLSRLDFFMIFPYAYGGNHNRFEGIHLDRCEAITLEASRPLYVHTDGEVVGEFKKIEMHLLDDKLKLLL